MNNSLNIYQAEKLLLDGYVLLSIVNDKRYIFIYENKQINIHTSSFKISLKLKDFINNFSSFKFSLIEDNDQENVSLLKDLDYYKNIQKKQ